MNRIKRSTETGGKRGSLRLRLSVAIAAAGIIVMAAGVAVDYRREYRAHTTGILASLEEQARALASARGRMEDNAAFAEYVDEFCAQMNQHVSPGHHILVLDASGQVLARAQHHSGRNMEAALLGAAPGEPFLTQGSHRVAQYRLQDGEVVLVLAQYLDHMEGVLHQQLLSRLATGLMTATATVILVFLLIHRWVMRPVAGLVAAARRWSDREFDARSPKAGPPEMQFLAEELNAMAGELAEHESQRLALSEKARRIQEGLLPKGVPEVKGLAIATEYRPAEHVAGDLYDVFSLPDGRTALTVFDVSGHGVSAALLTGVMKMSLHWRLAQEETLELALPLVNHDLLGCITDGQFATLFVAIWDPRTRAWTYSSAGHPDGLWMREGALRWLPRLGPLLGVLPDGTWSSRTLQAAPGDRFVMFTDGLMEAGAPEHMLGMRGIEQVLLEANGADLDDLTALLLKEGLSRSDDCLSDDLTILAVEVTAHE